MITTCFSIARRTARVLAASCAGALALGLANAQNRPIEIQMWMGLTGLGGETLVKYGEEFNRMQNEYKVTVSFKGQYPEQRAAAIAAYRAGNPPHIMQMFDAGSGDMMSAKGAIIPVSEVFRRAGLAFNPADFIAPARGYYGLKDGSLLSMPFNVSTAVLYYNKDVFRKAGLDPNKPPATWPELQKAAKKIRETNAANCGFTTTWLAWIHLEQFGARHNIPLGTKGNGRDGLDAELTFASNPLFTRQVQMLVDMQKDKSFDYKGRSNDASASFASGECAMITQSSGAMGAYQRDAKFDWGVAPLPYWPDVKGAPYATTIGGASLWVFNAPNRTDAELRGVARFLDYLRSMPVMMDWAKTTGFLPATNAAFDYLTREGYYAQNPRAAVAIETLVKGKQGEHTKGYRFGRWTEIRDFYHEEVEKALQGKQTAKEAIENAQRRGNAALRAFEKTALAAN
ncbi:MAG: sn-glycerol-3-phosphate ABC transporter substrate-binding protein UgpB [Casimicrobiaceae bacterium]|nr:sn-glycerol-3-phosphate ABC transporter substrate-binding protein UgpB [Casimicrobiaceae bacterium]MDW8311939.1 sn-glycerol-3-phosphate ABC transporter substrate-binding protein UgpB [Burkholderiales bacterium]